MKETNERPDTKHKNLITISAYTSKSDVNNLKNALNEALDAGLTIMAFSQQVKISHGE